MARRVFAAGIQDEIDASAAQLEQGIDSGEIAVVLRRTPLGALLLEAVAFAGGVKATICVARLTGNSCWTDSAGRYCALPGWAAMITHRPPARGGATGRT